MAHLIPSTAADIIPPAYPAPSPVLCQESRHEKNYFLFCIFKSGHNQLFL